MSLKKIKLSERIIDHLIQAVLIFISVFLAFWLSNYQKQQEALQVTNKAKAAVLAELELNHTTLKRNVAYYQEIYSLRKDFLKDGLDTLQYFNLVFIPGYSYGFEKFVLSTNSLSLANDARVNLPINYIVRINKIKEQIESVKISLDNLDTFLATEKKHGSMYTDYQKFYNLLGDLWGTGDFTVEQIEQTIQLLKQTNN